MRTEDIIGWKRGLGSSTDLRLGASRQCWEHINFLTGGNLRLMTATVNRKRFYKKLNKRATNLLKISNTDAQISDKSTNRTAVRWTLDQIESGTI
jgi:hypothetical protein